MSWFFNLDKQVLCEEVTMVLPYLSPLSIAKAFLDSHKVNVPCKKFHGNALLGFCVGATNPGGRRKKEVPVLAVSTRLPDLGNPHSHA